MSTPAITPAERELLAEARALAPRAQAPARERSGALAVTADGTRFPGVALRLPTAAGLSVCAEQVALCSARAANAAPIERICLWIPEAAGEHPCGRCLQTWLELAPGARFVLQRGDGEPEVLDLGERLPAPFTHFAPGAAPPFA